jgi:hypothetical protein
VRDEFLLSERVVFLLAEQGLDRLADLQATHIPVAAAGKSRTRHGNESP